MGTYFKELNIFKPQTNEQFKDLLHCKLIEWSIRDLIKSRDKSYDLNWKLN